MTVRTSFIGGRPRLCIDLAGDHGSTVLFLHGVGGNRSNWADQLAALSCSYRAVALDFRGYGDSADYEGELALQDFSRDIERVLDHLGTHSVHLVGLSMGGIVAMDFYRRHPQRVLTMTLADTGPGPANSGWTEHEIEDFIRLRRQPLLEGRTPADNAPAVAESLVGRAADGESQRRLIASLSALRVESYLKTLGTVTRYAEPIEFTSFAVPCHVIVGEDDRLTPPAMAEKMHEQIPVSRLTVIGRAGHLSNIEAPQEFNAAVLAFLNDMGF